MEIINVICLILGVSIFLTWYIVFSINLVIEAEAKGISHDSFLYSLIIVLVMNPIFAWTLIKSSTPNEEKQIKNKILKRCPACYEMVRVEALICKHCHSKLPERLS